MYFFSLIDEPLVPGAMAAGIIGAMAGMFLLIHILYAIILLRLSHKIKVDNLWLAFVPVGNIYITVRLAGLSGLWALIVLLSLFPNFGGSILFYLGFIYIWWKLLERLNHEGVLSLLWLVPPIGLVLGFIVAFLDKRTTKTPRKTRSSTRRKNR